MKKKIINRIISFLLTLLFVSLFVFAAVDLAKGDSSLVVLSDEAGVEEVERYRRDNGLYDIFLLRYMRFLKAFFSFSWGRTVGGEKVVDVILSRLPLTLSLTFFSIFLSLLISLPLLFFSLSKQGGRRQSILTALSSALMVIPTFISSLVLILIFSLWLKLFPVSGYVRLKNGIIPYLRSLFLPSLSLSFLHSAVMMKIMREALEESLKMNYTRTALAKGMKERKLVVLSAFRPSLPVLFSLVSDSLSVGFGGAAVVENIFALPGMGSLLVKGALERDGNLVSISVLIIAFLVSLFFFIADLGSYFIDPRQRRSHEEN
ncbi:MAG: ABC transporter permease [Candidatus Ornithospirochaeta sp.]|nr:ABC transporter permease [Sphaerochaetaceae bacterium]MDY5523467.1 ABC transporter permease [Candidatus Ornithospirochaeta sp.]